MRRAISDPTAGKSATEIGEAPSRRVRPMDPTDPRHPGRGDTSPAVASIDPADATRRRPVGHVFGRRRGETRVSASPDTPVLRLRGFRRARRAK